jgi:hypothetical protein
VDGGLYAELIRNRGFEDAKPPEGFTLSTRRPRNNVRSEYADGSTWKNPGGYATTYFFDADKSLPYWALIKEGGAQGSMALDLTNPLSSATPRSCRLEIQDSSGRIGIANEGFWGISVKAGDKYNLSFWARGEGFSGPLTATLETTDGAAVSDAATITGIGKEGQQDGSEGALCANCGRRGQGLVRHGVTLPARDVQEPPERFAIGHRAIDRRPEARFRPFPGRLCGGRRDDRKCL